MKILFVASRFPSPPVKGDQARVFNFLKHLAKKNDIFFVCTAENEIPLKEIRIVRSLCKQLHIIRLSKNEQQVNLLLNLVKLHPFQVAFFRSKKSQDIINKILSEVSIDVIFCQMIRTALYVQNVKLPKIIDYQDAYSLNMMRRFKSEGGLVRWVALVEWQLMRTFEKRMLKKFDLVTIVSEFDKRAIGGSDKVRVLPIGINSWNNKTTRVKNLLIFTGNLKYFPNRDAITWFAREVFPKVKEVIGDVKLLIVGATPPLDVQSLGELKGIQVIGNAPDLKKHLATATLAVAPMRSGSGTQFKVIEALSVGTPVLISKTAMNGLDFLSKRSIEVSDTNEQAFANKVIALLKDPIKLQSLARYGQIDVLKYYNWDKIGKTLEELLIEATKMKVKK